MKDFYPTSIGAANLQNMQMEQAAAAQPGMSKPRGALASHRDALSEAIRRAQSVGYSLNETADRIIGHELRNEPLCGSANACASSAMEAPDVVEMGRLIDLIFEAVTRIEGGASRLAGL